MRILFVCNGNICRSPLAAQAFSQIVANHSIASQVQVDSAGIFAMENHPMDPGSVLAMKALGFVPQPHVAKQLLAEHVEAADLVLTSTELQREGVVELHIKANRYTFTLKEFANLACFLVQPPTDRDEFVPALPTGLADKLAATLKWRGTSPLLETLDLADPYGQDQAVFQLMAQETVDALQKVTTWLK
jgi:protein-tyrosine phosphatase